MTKEELRKAGDLDATISALRQDLSDANDNAGYCPVRVGPETRLRIRTLVITDLERQIADREAEFASFSVQPTPPPPTLAA